MDTEYVVIWDGWIMDTSWCGIPYRAYLTRPDLGTLVFRLGWYPSLLLTLSTFGII
jgi:hypothetical protein